MCCVTWIPPATDCHQLMLSSSAYYKLQLLPGLLICVGVLSVKHLGVDATHQHHLNTTGPLKYLPIVPTPDTSPQTFWIMDCTMEQALLFYFKMFLYLRDLIHTMMCRMDMPMMRLK